MKFGRKKKQAQATANRRQVIGSSRTSAFSYHANRKEQDYNLGRQQPREQDVRSRARVIRYWQQRLGMLVAGIVLIVCVLDILHLSTTPKVISLTTTSNNYFLQPTSIYEVAATKLFKSSLLNDNKLTINTSDIKQKLQQQFPELSDVSITLPLMSHRPIVYIAPTTPSVVLSTVSGSFVLDNNGKALIRADAVADLSKLGLPTVVDQSGLAVKADEVALPSNSVAFIQSVVAELHAKAIPVNGLTLPAAAYELDIKPSGVGYFVKFNLHSTNVLQQVGTYLAVRTRLASQNITPASYIDVRLDGRAYYK
jgi:hypothetical protein